MNKEKELPWYESRFAKYVSIGVLVWGISTGLGNLIHGIRTSSKGIEYSMDWRTEGVFQRKHALIEEYLEVFKDKLTPEQVHEIMKEIAGELK